MALGSYSCLAFLTVLVQGGALSLDERPPIATDRPDFTESALVVPRGSVQIESGLSYELGPGKERSFAFPEALFRIGLTDRFELRLAVPDYSFSRTNGKAQEGFGDLYLGGKLGLGALGRTDVAIIPAVFIPAGRDGIRGEAVAPEIKLVAGQGLSGGRALSGMIYVASVQENGRRRTPVQCTLSLGAPVKGALAMFVEGVSDVERSALPRYTLHAGFVLASGSNAQFDVHFAKQVGIASRAGLLAGGYSVRF